MRESAERQGTDGADGLGRHEDRLAIHSIGEMARRQGEEDYGQRADKANQPQDGRSAGPIVEFVSDTRSHGSPSEYRDEVPKGVTPVALDPKRRIRIMSVVFECRGGH
jgi:hypothetical protein